MELITKQEAIEKGVKTFFHGRPCKKGHISDRFVSGGACVECIKNYTRTEDYREKNRLKAQRVRDENGDAHREYIREYMREYYKTEVGRENVLKSSKRYHDKLRKEKLNGKVVED